MRLRIKLFARVWLAVAAVTTLAITPPARFVAKAEEPPIVTLQLTVRQAYRAKPSGEALRWADERLKEMTLEEKAGQLISVGVNARFFNQQSDEFKELRRQVEQNHVGGIILFRGPVYESVHLVNRMQRLAKLPLLISADLEAGSAMRFEDTTNLPWNMAVGATGDPAFARRQGELTAC